LSEPMSQASARWLVSGRVQGVGFRWFVARHAEEEGLAGWVRNLPDGRVEVVARGEPEAVAALEALLRSGPRSAHVEYVEKQDISHEMVYHKTFEIR
jgi:acylphosphatase